MDWRCDAPLTVVLPPATANAQAFLPKPAALQGSVLLADRGYVDVHDLRCVQEAGGFLLIRAKARHESAGARGVARRWQTTALTA